MLKADSAVFQKFWMNPRFLCDEFPACYDRKLHLFFTFLKPTANNSVLDNAGIPRPPKHRGKETYPMILKGPTIRPLSIALLLLWLPGGSNAADIFGQIAGTSADTVKVKCSGSTGSASLSDGRYRVTGLPSNTLCRLSATAGNTESNAIPVRTSTTAIRFNGKLNRVGNLLILQSR